MSFPRLPDWLIYLTVVASICTVAVVRRDAAHAPPAPRPADAREGDLVGPNAPVDQLSLVQAPSGPLQPVLGTAFATGGQGQWLTARHGVFDCRKAAVLMSSDLAMPAKITRLPGGDLALLTTQGGPAGLPLGAVRAPHTGERAYAPGYPQGLPGEVALQYLGTDTVNIRGLGTQTVLAWAEIGRTDELGEQLKGLAGAPVLDRQGHVLGVMLAARPRRGRIFTTSTQTLALAAKRLAPAAEQPEAGEPITAENYGRIADSLRRDARVAEVRCLVTG
ncbi:MAG TPA: serine protease [Caulobacteraceae bacterium]|jgi:S1-C subfamily serine protease